MVAPELKSIILAAVKLNAWDITEETVADQVPGWDSLSHVNVILAVENHFGVRFTSREVLTLKNVGDLQRLVSAKVQAAR